jgi:hypothetical protein
LSGRVFGGIVSLLGVDIGADIKVEVGAAEDRKGRTEVAFYLE